MKIADSKVQMAGTYAKVKEINKEEKLRVWVGETRPDFEAQESGNQITSPQDRFERSQILNENPVTRLIQEVRASANLINTRQISPSSKTKNKSEESEETTILGPEEIKFTLMKLLLERMTGKKIILGKPIEIDTEAAEKAGQEIAEASRPQRQGWGMEYEVTETRYEAEATTFSAVGVATTKDGQEITFDVKMEMKREHLEISHMSVRAGDALLTDPLVINLNGRPVELSDKTFEFDLDADGKTENINLLKSNSGFLALDKNEDGVINDGNELFGPATGKGFTELSQYDEDGNMWIDEDDSIFSKLRIWTKTNREDHLSSLLEKGVGAIFLGNTSTPFELRDSLQNLQGKVRSTGTYLKEEGGAGTVQ